MVKVDHNYIRRVKSHILEFFSESEHPIGCIVGTNGYIWLFSPDQRVLPIGNTELDQTPVVKSVPKEARI